MLPRPDMLTGIGMEPSPALIGVPREVSGTGDGLCTTEIGKAFSPPPGSMDVGSESICCPMLSRPSIDCNCSVVTTWWTGL
eukprot:1100812-Amphidinium_carterae.1